MKNNFINEFKLPKDFYNLNKPTEVEIKKESLYEFSLNLKNIFSQEELIFLTNHIENKIKWIPVGIDGILKNYKEGDKIGSYRASFYEEKLADCIWLRIKKAFPDIREMKDNTPTNWDNSYFWKPIGVNPLFRLIKYKEKCKLIPHYDDSYIKDNDTRTLSSFIIYLTTNKTGKTRFLKDKQINLNLKDRNYQDQFFTPKKKSILKDYKATRNWGLIFDHRLLHDSEELINEEKIIIRTDILYRRLYD